jgi:Phospholipase_D-nuclease N-terminal
VNPLAASTFVEAMLVVMIMTPVVILWIAAVVDVFRAGFSGLKLAAVLVLILVVPVLGPILYFIFRKPEVSAEGMHMAEADRRREAARRPIGGAGTLN